MWTHLEERRPPFPLKLDDTAKQFLWNAIVRTPDIEFFALTEPFSHIFGTKHKEETKQESANCEPKNPLDQVCTVHPCNMLEIHAMVLLKYNPKKGEHFFFK